METNNKLREALETLLNLAYEVQDANSENGPKTSVPTQFIIDVAKSALAEPVRNCDVGTADEQAARMRAFCAKNGLCHDGAYRCENCGLIHEFRCELAWAQMPYEEGGAK